MLLHHFIETTARDCPDKTGLVVAQRSYRFQEIDEAADRLACSLQEMGVKRGDRVAAMLENGFDMVVALWGTLKSGAVFVPINTGVKADKLRFMLADSGAAVCLAPALLRERVAEAIAGSPTPIIWAGGADDGTGPRLNDILARPHRKPAETGLIDQDLCLIIYTSGSTGSPKGVMMTHRSIRNNVWSISTYLGNRPEDVVLCVLPLSFDYGLFQVLTGARIGFTLVLEKSFAFPYDVLKRIAQHRVTGLPGVPTIFAKLLEFAPFDGLDLSSLRYLSNTAAALPAAHIAALRKALPQAAIFSMYGLTECTRVAYLDPAKLARKPDSVGRAMPNSETWIVDERGRRCGPHEVGELVVRGTSLMRGYWKRPEATAQALRDGDLPGEKILYTGDLFWQDDEGDLYFVGRRDDVFKCRGEKVSPREVEACLYELDMVAEAAVTGVPHPTDGMAIRAHVVARDGQDISADTLRKHCLARLEPLLVPRFFDIRACLPKTDSGKISKTMLRQEAD